MIPVETMIGQMGKNAGAEFFQYLARPGEAHLIRCCLSGVDGSEQHLQSWHRILQKARLASPITDAQVRLALDFLRELEPDVAELNTFQMRYNTLFVPE